MQYRWSPRTAWIAMAAALVVSALLAYLVVVAAVDKDTTVWGRILLVMLGVAAVLAALVATNDAPWQESSLTAWLRPKPIAMLFVAIFGAFGVLTGAIGLLSPRPSIEDRPHQIQDDVSHIRAKVDQPTVAPPRARILSKIQGFWGERGCAVIFQMKVDGNALRIDGIRQPPKTEQVTIVAAITAANGDILESRGVTPPKSEGIAATFTYVGNAYIDRLVWRDQTQQVPLELERCNGA